MKRTIRIERVYAHPRAKVWRAITSSEAIAAWLMENDFEARIGHEFTLRTEPAPGFDGIVHCRVTELEPPHRLAFTWVGGPVDTLVSFDLAEVADGTRLVMNQTGFEGFKPVLVSLILGSGCRKIYGELLPAVLDRMDPETGDLAPAQVDKDCEKGLWSFLARLFSPLMEARKPS